MGSSRLPGKILSDVAGLPMLELILRRVGNAQRVNRLLVATTELPEDDEVSKLCARLDIECFRGSQDDCLDRIYRAAIRHEPDTIVRLTGDNPAPDGAFVDWVIDQFYCGNSKCDYIDTTSSGSFPYGLSVEVMSMDALSASWREAGDADDREHVTRFIRQRPDRFVCRALSSEHDDHHMRLTVDLPADLERMDRLFRIAGRWDIDWRELLALARTQ